MTWVPFVYPKEGETVKCTTCNDYGGIYDDETMNREGLPHEMACPDCPEEFIDVARIRSTGLPHPPVSFVQLDVQISKEGCTMKIMEDKNGTTDI